jgi:ribose transport system ATP-binding protein
MSPGPVVLAARSVSKHFAGTAALVDASLCVRRGTVHALLGGNGSGKSTLIKCLAGVYPADRGTVELHGTEVPAAQLTPRRAHAAGLRFVHQDLGLFDTLTVAENIALGAGFPRTPLGGVRWRQLRADVADLLDRFDIAATPDTPLRTLRPAVRTMVAIARALQDQQGSEYVLLLDEPTASLPAAESTMLMSRLRQRAALGQTIVLVSHRLQEVLANAVDLTVLRDGRVAASLPVGRATEAELVELMAGRAVAQQVGPARAAGAGVLDVRGVHAGPLRGLDLAVAAGEIVGLAGLLGSGRSTALSVVFGLHLPDRGAVLLAGQDVTGRGVAQMVRRGVALVPQDRLRDAALPGMSVRDNAAAADFGRYFRGWMRTGRERADTSQLLHRFRITAPSVEAPLSSLSGGNQQKVILARWLRRDPLLLLLDEPTQGVDAMSRADIYAAVRAVAAGGCGVLVASSDPEELALLCDRVVVLRGGRAVADLNSAELTAERITAQVQKESAA